jgi:nucleotide-binding universal stress UspA family protein
LLKTILVGYDGTEQSIRALEYALQLVEGNITEPSTVHLAFVVQKPSGVADPLPEEAMQSLQNAGREVLANGARVVRKELQNPVTHLEMGPPPEKLLELAQKLKPDVVVIGMAKHPATDRIIGTVSALFYKTRLFPVLSIP